MPSSGMNKDAPPLPSAQAVLKGIKATREVAPVWTMRSKPEMVIGGVVPSWVNSIPGPKYKYDLNKVLPQAPSASIRGIPKSLGASKSSIEAQAPNMAALCAAEHKLSTQRSVPGFKFSTKDRFAYTKESLNGSNFMDPKKAGDALAGRFGGGRGPVFSMRGRLPTEGELKKDQSPGPIYRPEVPPTKAASIGKKLPSEADLMKVRSPGPATQAGAAMCGMKQATVDSTMRKARSCSFGIGARFDGPTSEMLATGATQRYERGKHGVELRPGHRLPP